MTPLSDQRLIEILDDIKRACGRNLISHASYEDDDIKGGQKIVITVCINAEKESLTDVVNLIKKVDEIEFKERLKIAAGAK